jgi:hypothetical protein
VRGARWFHCGNRGYPGFAPILCAMPFLSLPKAALQGFGAVVAQKCREGVLFFMAAALAPAGFLQRLGRSQSKNEITKNGDQHGRVDDDGE